MYMYLFLSECLFLTQRTIKNSRDASEEPFYAFIRRTIQHISGHTNSIGEQLLSFFQSLFRRESL
jgi:hypothetical protein